MTASNSINYIDVSLMEKSCHPFAMDLFDVVTEPMTAYHEHDLPLLESALANPRQSYGGKELYPTLQEKAAILYYGLIKNHPFKNGNKRAATATFLVFLHINDRWIIGDSKNEDFLISLAIRVAKSEGHSNKEAFLAEIKKFLDEKMCTLEEFKRLKEESKK